MKILGIIPARGGSKGIPKKNIYPLCSRPLISYTCEAALESKLLTKTIISSDSLEIIRIAEEYGIEAPFVRSDNLSQDNTPALPVIQHAVNWIEKNQGFIADIIILLQPTSPLRESKHIDEALGILKDSDADSVVSVVKVPHNYNPYSVMIYEGGYLNPFLDYDENKNLRQSKPVMYARNGAAIYGFTRKCLLEKGSIYGDKILPYEMDMWSSIDIDNMFDIKVCEMLLKMRDKCI